ncbi:MarR family winged helix-turn-helix transcriptional regulator [uncultured Ruthenibacterium sp.]|uniref:MarR family winged helix-turn-helix transcriptional regulator n=1 Tax=uncultured Ruthenibacterium sp. TaxID=1905347 RepID=UPI00349E8A07
MKRDDHRTALNNFKRIHAGIEISIGRFFARKELTAAQGHILLYILARPQQRLCSTELHRTLGLSRATVSELLKKLREKGFITFYTAPEDERQKQIVPTTKALDLKLPLDRLATQTEKQIFAGFSPQEMETLLCFQMRILENLNNKEDNCNGNRSQSDTAV